MKGSVLSNIPYRLSAFICKDSPSGKNVSAAEAFIFIMILEKKGLFLFYIALRKGGFYMLGSSETIGKRSGLFSDAETVYSKVQTDVYKKSMS